MGVSFETIAEAAAPGRKQTSFRAKDGNWLLWHLSAQWRRVRRWGYGTPLYEWRLKGQHPLQLLASPGDPAPGIPSRGELMVAGRLPSDGADLPFTADLWQAAGEAGGATKTACFGFRFLTDLAAASDQARAAERAEAVTAAFLALPEAKLAALWSPAGVADRLIHWLAHAPLVLSSSDLVYRSQLLLVMARHARHLKRVWRDAAPGIDQLKAATALIMAGLLLPAGASWLLRGRAALSQICEDFIQADGGPKSRNVEDALTATRLLTLARSSFLVRDQMPPDAIQRALDRMAPFIRALRHGDGSFAHFAGANSGVLQTTNALLLASKAEGQAIKNAPRTGYQRVSLGRSLLIIDTGPPPPSRLSRKAAASTGCFEFSSGRHRLICNMGYAAPGGPLDGLEHLWRSTAAHSGLVLGHRNSARIDERSGLISTGVSEVSVSRQDEDAAVSVSVVHNGYQRRFGILTGRRLTLSAGGLVLAGQEFLNGSPKRGLDGIEASIRFHLGPSVRAAFTHDDQPVLETESGDSWLMECSGGDFSIEESLFLPKPADIQQTQQLVITLQAIALLKEPLEWRLTRRS